MAMVEMQTNAALAESRRKMQARRRLKNRIPLTLSMATMAFGLFWLIWILMSTITRGIDGMSLALFTEMTPPPNTEGGGLANALAGSGLLILWATVFGTPLGIMAGIYLAEYGRKSWLAEVIRFINDILLSAPSIVVGLFVYTIVVAQMEHFSGWAGVIALALLQVPIVIRTTENMLKLVPDSLREAAYALGTPKWKMISAITLKASVSGIMTGILLAIARIAGETAPLLLIGAPFQIKVWQALLAIPSGHVTTYSEIAQAIGTPKAVRAVGTAVGRNPISWLIPCHRALRKSGALGGYHWGLRVKRAMLAYEAARQEA